MAGSPARAGRWAIIPAAIMLITLAACDAGAPQPAGGVSKGEAQALAEAAEMLDENRSLPDEALEETGANGQAGTQSAP
ncbi:MAG: hypothetical protein ACXIT4_01870 [Erythrobacter sp.]